MVRLAPAVHVRMVLAVRRPVFVRRCPCLTGPVTIATSQMAQLAVRVVAKAVFVTSRTISIQSARTGMRPQVQDLISPTVHLAPAVLANPVLAVQLLLNVRPCPYLTERALIPINLTEQHAPADLVSPVYVVQPLLNVRHCRCLMALVLTPISRMAHLAPAVLASPVYVVQPLRLAKSFKCPTALANTSIRQMVHPAQAVLASPVLAVRYLRLASR